MLSLYITGKIGTCFFLFSSSSFSSFSFSFFCVCVCVLCQVEKQYLTQWHFLVVKLAHTYTKKKYAHVFFFFYSLTSPQLYVKYVRYIHACMHAPNFSCMRMNTGYTYFFLIFFPLSLGQVGDQVLFDFVGGVLPYLKNLNGVVREFY